MKSILRDLMTLKVWSYGLLHALVSFTALTVITQVAGLNLSLAFLFAGIGTLVFHLVTKNELPSVLGVSALYLGGIIAVSQNHGLPYVYGGVIMAGLIYIVFALIMFKWQDKVMSLFPDWLLSMIILLIALTLIPIGTGMIENNYTIGILAISITALVDLIGRDKLKPFAMPLAIVGSTLISYFFLGQEAPVVDREPVSFVFPKFNIEAFLTISLISIACLFEMMGDIKNVGSIIGKDVFKKVGVGRISLGNGLASIIGGLGNSGSYTTYSENNGFLIQTRYFNPNTQIATSAIFIVIAFITPLHQMIAYIPSEAFGGVLIYLFSTIGIQAIKNIMNSGVDFNRQNKVFIIMSVMLGVSLITFTFGGISVSSVAVASLTGAVLHLSFNR